MINTSIEFKRAITRDRKFCAKAEMELTDGTKISFTDENIMSNGIQIDDATSSSGKFDVGAAIINKLILRIDNSSDFYSQYDFNGAQVIPYLGLQLKNGVEWLKKGVFCVDEPTTPGATIVIEALDNMRKFDRPYTESRLTYPATLLEIIQDACLVCNVPLESAHFDNDSYVVDQRPADPSLTFRGIVAYCTQIAGCFARCNTNGALEIKWYNFGAFEDSDNLDGDKFDNYDPNVYLSGDNADGGNFDDYSSGDNADGGNFDTLPLWHHIYALKSQSICTDDVVITGIKVAADLEGTEEAEEFSAGSDGYMLEITGNPLIQKGKAEKIAKYLNSKIGGSRFRPLNVTSLSDPSIEAGDPAVVSDHKGNSYLTVLTRVKFVLGGAETYSCEAESPARRNAARMSAETKALVKSRRETEKQISVYDRIVKQMTQTISQGMGMYTTEVKQQDGSYVTYMHDKPTIKESSYVCVKTAQGFMGSIDGGTTWALDKNGNALVKVLTAVGINCDWIRGGTLTLGGKNNEYGWMKILDPYGSVIGAWDKNGIEVSNGKMRVAGKYSSVEFNEYGYFNFANFTNSSGLQIGMATMGGRYTAMISVKNIEGTKECVISPEWSTLFGLLAIEKSDAFGDKVLSARGDADVYGNLLVLGDFECKGLKNRIVQTKNYGGRALNAYETPEPYFADFGSSQVGHDGTVFVPFEDIFCETITPETGYFVMLTKCGPGDIYVAEKRTDGFTVSGTPGLAFDYSVTAAQKGYENIRLKGVNV